MIYRLSIVGDYKWDDFLNGDIEVATAKLNEMPRVKVTKTSLNDFDCQRKTWSGGVRSPSLTRSLTNY